MYGALGAFLVIGPAWAGANDERAAGGSEEESKEVLACKANLNKIFEAIEQYRGKFDGHLPEWLFDLHPEFLKDPRTFICPAVLQKGDFQSWRERLSEEVFWNPVLPISYTYEFSVKEYPLWAGFSSTVREFKQRQMTRLGTLGTKVPILRCFAHRQTVNLSFGGEFCENWGKDWEGNVTYEVTSDELAPIEIFKDYALCPGRTFLPIPSRDPDAPACLLDLSNYFMAPLSSPWVFKNRADASLATLPQGIGTLPLVGVSFDLRGVIPLKGRGNPWQAAFPESVESMAVQQKCRHIHFLHGCVAEAPPGTVIGRYEVNYSNGRSLPIPIVYGKDVISWKFDPKRPLTGSATVAWEGPKHASDARGQTLRLYLQQWQNPHEDEEIASIHFVSALTMADPFLIAITLEP